MRGKCVRSKQTALFWECCYQTNAAGRCYLCVHDQKVVKCLLFNGQCNGVILWPVKISSFKTWMRFNRRIMTNHHNIKFILEA